MSQETNKNEWPLWEVFIRSKAGLDHKHAGSLHAADAQMAMENARDVYTRRMEGLRPVIPGRESTSPEGAGGRSDGLSFGSGSSVGIRGSREFWSRRNNSLELEGSLV